MTVEELKSRMTYDEFLGWMDYFSRRPVGWREDDRTFKILQSWGCKEKPYRIFPSLEPIYHPAQPLRKDGSMDANQFIKSGFFQQLMHARGGDKINLAGIKTIDQKED